MASDQPIRLIVNADDFGSSDSANTAIERAHREGILTSASLMVNGNRANEAVDIARRNPVLAVGLHLVLVCGKSTLKPSEIISVVDQKYQFSTSPVFAGMRYFFTKGIHQYIRQEIHAQFREFRTSGLELDHLNGHLNFHLHPTVFNFLKKDYMDLGIRAMRLTRDPYMQNLRLAAGRYFYRTTHAFIFDRLSKRVEKSLSRRKIHYTDATYGLLQNDRITERYLLKLLEELRPGTWELYCHPDLGSHSHELEALISPRVKDMIRNRGIVLCRYSDLE
jgi:hopanoid biosynthesis associated protein HpnK